MDFLINKKLKIFITLMETGSFSIATSVLYITRTPLSRVISDLERAETKTLYTEEWHSYPNRICTNYLSKSKIPLYFLTCTGAGNRTYG